MPTRAPRRIQLSPERRAALLAAIEQHFSEAFDEPVSRFRAEGLLDFFVRHLGPPVYNQGVHDAAAHLAEKLADIEGEIQEVDDGR